MQKTILYGNQIQISEPILITEENAFLTEKFDCGNEVINHYLKSEAKKDTQAVSFLITDEKKNAVIGYFSLSCSGFIIESQGHPTIYPAVEIKMFAVDEAYQHIPYSDDPEDGTLSDIIFNFAISKIYDFTEKYCGADKVILYAVPKAVNFYRKNFFSEFETFHFVSQGKPPFFRWTVEPSGRYSITLWMRRRNAYHVSNW